MEENNRIERMRKKLHERLNKYERTSTEVYEVSKRMDKLINQIYETERPYPSGSIIKTYYYLSYRALLKLTKYTGEFPSVKEWNDYAVKNRLLNNVSIEYISGMNWHDLRDYILLEIN